MVMTPAFRREPPMAPLHLPLLGMIVLIIVLLVLSLVAPPAVAAPAQNANIARTYYQLAGQYLQSGMKLKAREEFQRAADLDTTFLEAQLQAAEERVDLLETKMAALRQQYESQDAMVPGYVIQQQIAETSENLARAQAQLARIRGELDKRKAGTSQGLSDIER